LFRDKHPTGYHYQNFGAFCAFIAHPLLDSGSFGSYNTLCLKLLARNIPEDAGLPVLLGNDD
jgi:hypothetical protein